MTSHGNVSDHLVQFDGLGGYSKNARLTHNIIWISMVWVIWKEENRRIFQHKDEHLQYLTEQVKFQSF